MKTMLIVLWLTTAGNYELREGWNPRVQPDIKTCTERALNIKTYVQKYYKEEVLVFCI